MRLTSISVILVFACRCLQYVMGMMTVVMNRTRMSTCVVSYHLCKYATLHWHHECRRQHADAMASQIIGNCLLLFVQEFVYTNIKQTSKPHITGPLWEEFHTKYRQCGKSSHGMVSPWKGHMESHTLLPWRPHQLVCIKNKTWWRHQMNTFSALIALCEGNPPVNLSPVDSLHKARSSCFQPCGTLLMH